MSLDLLLGNVRGSNGDQKTRLQPNAAGCKRTFWNSLRWVVEPTEDEVTDTLRRTQGLRASGNIMPSDRSYARQGCWSFLEEAASGAYLFLQSSSSSAAGVINYAR